MDSQLPFSCPICGRKTDYPVAKLKKGALLTCPFCKLKLTLHGHMLEEVEREIKKMERKASKKAKPRGAPGSRRKAG